jgi:H/ACA ribonucleoprotein complex subunit 4
MKTIQEILNFSIINLDKPAGPTSFKTSQKVKHLFNLQKTAHFGTLDPMVTGVLPVALNRACKLNEVFMHRDKTYVGIMRIHQEVDEEKLKQTIQKFIGKIMQLPPIKSRVKRQVREREIKTFEILSIKGKDIEFKTQVQAGTYIRKLCHDMGEDLGTGAHMAQLRRTQAGLFTDKDLVTIEQLEKAIADSEKGSEESLRKILQPAEDLIKQIIPVVQANPNSINQLLVGKPLMKQDIIDKLPEEEVFAIFNKEQFIGTYKKTDDGDIIARAMFVFN